MHAPPTNSKPAPAVDTAPVVTRLQFPAWLPAVLLALVTMALYWPALRCGFISFDDPQYVSENVQVQKGLTLENISWAFVNPVFSNWHPLTMLSHMLDCQLYGLKPWGHHLTSLLLHTANTVLVFLLFRSLTGVFWRSALVATLFGVHPLHVESVAWVAERKDVLSTLFWMLTLWAYAKYAESAEGRKPTAKAWYGSALAMFVFGLMSKAMLVTMPCVLLLLDYWPLERFKSGRARQLVIEKIPFFVLAAAASVLTFVVQKQGGAVMTTEGFPPGIRVENALISYCRYLGKMFWPTDLAVFYPHPGYWPLEKVLLAGVFLCGISLIFFVKRNRHPFLLMGWLWFVGTLVPVIGLVQAGEQSMADRYTYVPSLGVLILSIWGAHELARRWRHQVIALSAAGSAAIVLCIVITRQQLGYWKDSETLFRHALAVTKDNELAHNNLGIEVLHNGQTDEAISHFQEAVRLKPDAAEIHDNLASALLKKGQTDEAIRQSQEAIRLKPDFAGARINLGLALFNQGQTDEAISEFQEAIRLKPDIIEAHINLGVALLNKGQTDEAFRQFQGAIRLKPDYGNAHYNLGVAFLNQSQADEAISEFQETIRLKPDDGDAQSHLAKALELQRKLKSWASDPAALNNAAWELATSSDGKIRNGTLAVKLAERACEQTHYRITIMIGTLAAAYAEAGRFDEAVATGKKACALASELGETELLKRNQELVTLYQARRPYHEPPSSAAAPLVH